MSPMINVTKTQILSIYKQLLKESKKFESYNYKMYALRRIRDAFKSNKELENPNIIIQEFEYATNNLDIIKRQVIIGQLYSTEKLVIENKIK